MVFYKVLLGLVPGVAGYYTRSHLVWYKVSLTVSSCENVIGRVWYKLQQVLAQGMAGSYTMCERVWYKVRQDVVKNVA